MNSTYFLSWPLAVELAPGELEGHSPTAGFLPPGPFSMSLIFFTESILRNFNKDVSFLVIVGQVNRICNVSLVTCIYIYGFSCDSDVCFVFQLGSLKSRISYRQLRRDLKKQDFLDGNGGMRNKATPTVPFKHLSIICFQKTIWP